MIFLIKIIIIIFMIIYTANYHEKRALRFAPGIDWLKALLPVVLLTFKNPIGFSNCNNNWPSKNGRGERLRDSPFWSEALRIFCVKKGVKTPLFLLQKTGFFLCVFLPKTPQQKTAP